MSVISLILNTSLFKQKKLKFSCGAFDEISMSTCVLLSTSWLGTTALVKEGKLKIIKKALLDLGICKECVIWDSKRLGDRQTGKDTKKQNWLRQVSKTVQGWLLFLFATIVLYEKCCENY